MSPVALIATLIQLYMFCVIIWAIVSTLVSFNIINGHTPIVYKVMNMLDSIVQPALRPLQRILPNMGGLDLSPILLLVLLSFLQQFVMGLGDAQMTYFAFIRLLSTLITLYTYCVGAYVILQHMINFKLVNPYQTLVRIVMDVLRRLCGPLIMKIRRYVPTVGNIDFASIILLVALIAGNHLLLRMAVMS